MRNGILMIKTDITRWYDVQCDAPDCGEKAGLFYSDYFNMSWDSPSKAVDAALTAGWQRREEDGVEHMYCPKHKKSAKHVKYRAVCHRCGSCGFSRTVGTIEDGYADFAMRGWQVRLCGIEPPIMICPDCAKKDKQND